MKIKQFLKPDWRKIVIFVIIILINFIISLYNNFILVENFNLIIVYVGTIIYIVFFLPQVILWFIQTLYIKSLSIEEFGMLKSSGTLGMPFLIIYILSWVLNIIYWYLLSCLIFWIYDKFRKGKKK